MFLNLTIMGKHCQSRKKFTPFFTVCNQVQLICTKQGNSLMKPVVYNQEQVEIKRGYNGAHKWYIDICIVFRCL